MFSINKITKSVEKLIDISEILFPLDKLSDQLILIEKSLNFKKIYIPFNMKIVEDKETVTYFSWKKSEKGKQWRFFYIVDYKENPNQTYKKAFLETKMEIRLKYGQYVSLFVEKFTEHLENKSNLLKTELGIYTYEDK